MILHLSIFTATVMTESALERPYAVASTTFPNAPDPSVLPARRRRRRQKGRQEAAVIGCAPFPLSPAPHPLIGPLPQFLGQQQPWPRGSAPAPGHAGSCLRRFVRNNTHSVSCVCVCVCSEGVVPRHKWAAPTGWSVNGSARPRP